MSIVLSEPASIGVIAPRADRGFGAEIIGVDLRRVTDARLADGRPGRGFTHHRRVGDPVPCGNRCSMHRRDGDLRR